MKYGFQVTWRAKCYSSNLQDAGYGPYLYHMRFYLDISHRELWEREGAR